MWTDKGPAMHNNIEGMGAINDLCALYSTGITIGTTTDNVILIAATSVATFLVLLLILLGVILTIFIKRNKQTYTTKTSMTKYMTMVLLHWVKPKLSILMVVIGRMNTTMII